MTNWDGGFIGGRPVWVIPDRLPPTHMFQCPRCDGYMPLLVQLFAPVDSPSVPLSSAVSAVSSPPAPPSAAAHIRMLYIFACVRESCVNRGSDSDIDSHLTRHLSQPSVLVLRAQHDPPAAIARTPASTCTVCGLPSSSRCSRCSRAGYCSRAHQAWHWSHGHKARCSAGHAAAYGAADVGEAVADALLFPPHEMCVDVEPGHAQRRLAVHASLTPASRAAMDEVVAGVGSTAMPPGHGGDVEARASIGDLTQTKLAEMTGRDLQADSAMQYFLRRTSCEPSQVFRYCRWPRRVDPVPQVRAPAEPAASAAATASSDAFVDEDEQDVDADAEPVGAPLWTSVKHTPPHDVHRQPRIPACEHCGAPRAYECQVLPQMIATVTPKAALSGWSPAGSDAGSSAPRITIDFGTIIVYTCTASCSPPATAPCPYLQEFVWVQPMEQSSAPIITRVLQEAQAEAEAADGDVDADDGEEEAS